MAHNSLSRPVASKADMPKLSMLALPIVFAIVLAACGKEERPAAPGGIVTPPDRSAVAGSAPETPSPTMVETRMLPDLQVSSPGELYIHTGIDGVREIRFSTTIANMGDGPLTMVGAYDPATTAVSTIQHIQHTDGSVEEYDVGRFVFDDGHEHWHLEDFIVFELLALDDAGQPAGLLASTGKMTFCLADSHPVADPPANAASKAGVTSCDSTVQGISVGWEDVYIAELTGQELDIPDLPDGRYAIRSTVDPDGLLLEIDNENNSTTNYVDVTGSTITFLE